MAKRKKKRMSKEELRRPDEVEVRLKRIWDSLNKYKKPLIASLVILIVGTVGWSIYKRSAASAKDSRAEALHAAFEPLAAFYGEDVKQLPENTPLKTFETRKAALEAADKGVDAFLAEHKDESGAVSFIDAMIQLPLGDADKAVEALSAWTSSHADSPLYPAAMMRLAEAQAQAGKKDEAVASYRKVADLSGGFVKVQALVAIGDLLSPVTGGSDAAKAKAAYEEAKAVLGPTPPKNPADPFASLNTPYLYSELDTKLAALN